MFMRHVHALVLCALVDTVKTVRCTRSSRKLYSIAGRPAHRIAEVTHSGGPRFAVRLRLLRTTLNVATAAARR